MAVNVHEGIINVALALLWPEFSYIIPLNKLRLQRYVNEDCAVIAEASKKWLEEETSVEINFEIQDGEF